MSEPETKYQLTALQQSTMARAVALAEEQLRKAREIVAMTGFRDLSPSQEGSIAVALATVIASNYGHVLAEKP